MRIDSAPELVSAATIVGGAIDTSTPYAPEANAIAERGVGVCKKGTVTLLYHAGLPADLWPLAGE